MSKTEATIKLSDAQIYFLRTRYGARKNISANRLVLLAVLEAVRAQAKKDLAQNGYAPFDVESEVKVI